MVTPYFLRIIAYNFVTISGIATKFCISMRPYPPFQHIKSQGNQIMILCFTTTFTPWQKEEKRKKNEETKPIFEGSYLGKTSRHLFEIWIVRWWCLPAFPSQKPFGFIKLSQSYIYMKMALMLFLLIIHGCSAPASWATHTGFGVSVHIRQSIHARVTTIT